MGNTPVDYGDRLRSIRQEVDIHLARMDDAFEELTAKYPFAIDEQHFATLLDCRADVAFVDQIIYRFAKVQDTIGARLFKTFLLYQGENVDKPFRDILHALERLHIVDVDEWFALREIRNSIAHQHEHDSELARAIVNSIYTTRHRLMAIVQAIDALVDRQYGTMEGM